MARTALILRYQWRAYWRRFLSTGHAKFYLTMLLLLGGLFFFRLPQSFSEAARELAAGQTATMDGVLLVVCVVWLLVVNEDASASLSGRRLRRFPLSVDALLQVKLLSLWCSPVTWVIALGSVRSLMPLFSARHPLLGSVAALMLFALIVGMGISASQLLRLAGRRLLVPAAMAGIAAGAFVATLGPQGVQQWRASATASSPAHLVTAVAVAATTPAALIPFGTLAVSVALVWYLLRWSFRRSLSSQPARHAGRRATGVVRFPGRLGGLVQKEQHYLRSVLDLWASVLLVLAACTASLFTPLSPTVRQSIMVIACALTINVTLNGFGLDRPAALHRYLIFPLRGRDLLLAKNLGLMVILAVPFSLLMASGVWQSGVVQAGADIMLATVLLLAHMAWGNILSVLEPLKTQPYRFAPSGEPVTGLVSLAIGSAPAVAVILLLRDDSPMAAWAIAAIVLLTMTAYYGSLRSAGKSFERRIHAISDRLA